MPNYVRARQPGGSYFFTVVTRDRQPLLIQAQARIALRTAIQTTRSRWPFMIDAWVLLPDHLHTLWTLPETDADFSRRWAHIKRLTTQAMGRPIWQPRFWEHLIRDEHDRQRHLDYIHGNPVKHGLVSRAVDWPYSTFHRHVRQGMYAPDWYDTHPETDLE